MEIKKTHIFLKENKWTGMGGQPIECITVQECRLPSGSLATPSKSLYFKEVRNGYHQILEMITTEEFQKLEAQTKIITDKM